jgi:hypothetical protein
VSVPTQADGRRALSLAVPCETGYLVLARLFATAAGRALGLDETGIEDLKIGVTEVCSGAIAGAPDGLPDLLQLEVWRSDGHVRLQLRSVGAIDLGRLGEEEVSRLDLLLALFADVHLEGESSGGSVVGLSVSLPSG